MSVGKVGPADEAADAGDGGGAPEAARADAALLLALGALVDEHGAPRGLKAARAFGPNGGVEVDDVVAQGPVASAGVCSLNKCSSPPPR